MSSTTSVRASTLVAAVIAGLVAGACSPGCGKAPTTGPGTTNGPDGKEPPVVRRDPAVDAALKKRSDLAETRVILIGMDGADQLQVRRLVRDGRLPNFKRILDEGAFGPLRSQPPMLSPLLWTTISTGKYPDAHGVLDFMRAGRDDPSQRETVTSDMRQVEAMWDIASRYGSTVGLVGWLASHPAEKVNGFAVSERTELLAYLFNQKVQKSDEGKTWPPDLIKSIDSLRREPAEVSYEELKGFLNVTEDEFKAACTSDEFTDYNRTNNLRLIYAGADNFRRIGQKLLVEQKPRLFCSYFEAIDATAHNFQAYEEPITWKPLALETMQKRFHRYPVEVVNAIHAFETEGTPIRPAIEAVMGQIRRREPHAIRTMREVARGARPEEVERWGDTVTAMYEWHDRVLGEYMALMDENTVLIVVSDHGFRFGPGKPPFDSSFNSRKGGASYHHEDGVLAIYGKGVRKGFEVPPFSKLNEAGPQGARLIDIAPTTLALLGFPRAEDMPGRILSEIFETDLEVGTVETYETDRARRLAKERLKQARSQRGAGGQDLDSQVADKMNALAIGYVGSSEEAELRVMLHLAQTYIHQDKEDEALEALKEAIKASSGLKQIRPLHTRGNLHLKGGRDDEAEADFRSILKLDPKALPGWFGLAGLANRKGDLDQVVAIWEDINKIQPDNPAWRLKLAQELRRRASRKNSATWPEEMRRALKLVDETVNKGPDGEPLPLSAAGHNVRGMILLDLRKFPEAIKEFETASDEDPLYLRPRNNLGVTHMRLAHGAMFAAQDAENDERRAEIEKKMAEHRQKALDWFADVLNVDPDNSKARYNRGELFLRLPPQDVASARSELEKALEIDENYKKARDLLDRINNGSRRSTVPR